MPFKVSRKESKFRIAQLLAAGSLVCLLSQAPASLADAPGDPVAGQKTGRACLTCHTVDKGGATRIGPTLWNVSGRPIASIPGFNYSTALKSLKGRSWNDATLDTWLTSPAKLAPGTYMSYGGMASPSSRADVIAWLKTLSDKSPPAVKAK